MTAPHLTQTISNGRSAGKLPEAMFLHDSETDTERATDSDAVLTTLSHDHLSQSDIDGVETFLLFVGWPRSCHSIIGSMLDAHPNMVIAHEYGLFQRMNKDNGLSLNRSQLYDELYKNAYMSLTTEGSRDSRNYRRGYTLNIDGSWHGGFTSLRVIGDKSGGKTVMGYKSDSENFKKLYQQLAASVKVPVKVLQIIRNPLDMIATNTLYASSSVRGTKTKATHLQKYSNFTILNKSASAIVNISKTVMRMVPDLGLSPLEVHCEDLIADPAKTLSDICRFLDLECPPDYLQMCVDKTFKTVSESRHTVDFDPSTLPSIIKELRTFPFFQRYNLSTKEVL